MTRDDKSAARGIKREVVTETGVERLLSKGVELLSYFFRVRGMVAAITAEFRERADIGMIFRAPADDACKILGVDFRFHDRCCLLFRWHD